MSSKNCERVSASSGGTTKAGEKPDKPRYQIKKVSQKGVRAISSSVEGP